MVMIFQILSQSFSNMTLQSGTAIKYNVILSFRKMVFTLRALIAAEMTKIIGAIVRFDIAAFQVI
jgi:hypothetical protein